jgi:hypothetical protein
MPDPVILPDPELLPGETAASIEQRIEIGRVSAGAFGLPIYSAVELWTGHARDPRFAGTRLLFFCYDRQSGGWTILRDIDPTYSFEGAKKALEAI